MSCKIDYHNQPNSGGYFLLKYDAINHLKFLNMINIFKVDLASLGFLRMGLFALAITSTLMSLIDSLLQTQASSATTDSFWTVFLTVVVPVLSLLFIVVIFFDYVMSRVRAADLQDDSRLHFLAISRIELLIIALMLAYWVPFFMSLGR